MSQCTVYHATNAGNAAIILDGELKPHSYVTSSLALAEYYAETVEDEGAEAVILAFALPVEAVLAPDYGGIFEPIMTVLRSEFGFACEDDLHDAWESTTGTGDDCFDLIGSAVLVNSVPGSAMTVVYGECVHISPQTTSPGLGM